jgi:GNAT superfamily N-acetyltransferase
MPVFPTNYGLAEPLREQAAAEGLDFAEREGRHWLKLEGEQGELQGIAYVDLGPLTSFGVFVLPDHRSKGVAIALVDAIMVDLHRRGLKSVMWQIPATLVKWYQTDRPQDRVMAVGQRIALVVGYPERYAG